MLYSLICITYLTPPFFLLHAILETALTHLRVAAMFLTNRAEMSNHYRGHSIKASYQISVHLAKRFQRRIFFRNQPIRKKELPVAAMSINGLGRNKQSLWRTVHTYFLPSFGALGQAVS